MNKTYRLIWNDVRQSWTVTHEAANSRGKPASKAKPIAAALTGLLLAHGPNAQALDPNALPTGGQVVAGQASISQAGSAMTINQATDKTILNWNSFSIGANASVNFQQPSSSSVALNRVIGSDPSAIYGSLTANGQVFLVNPNGVLFGQGARVDVGGLVASTLNIRDEDFLAGDYRFSRDGSTGSVVNQGELYGKYIALLAPEVLNEGVIAAHQGTVVLAAGDAVTLNITGNRLIDVAVDQASLDTLVENRHLIQADDGMVIMSAQSANGLIGRVVNSGAVEAQGIVNDGGVVRLLASSSVEHSGSINVDGGTTGNGGEAILLASLSNPDSLTDVSGTLSARGGSEAGDGGFVETSAAHVRIQNTVRVDTRAPNGANGQWLIDPIDYTVAAAGGDIDGATLSANLELGDVTIDTTGAGAGNGDIFINDVVDWSAGLTPGTLRLIAYRNIEINADMAFGDFLGPPQLEITYGTGGSGTAVIKQGVDWSLAGNLFDNTTGQITVPDVVDTSRDFYIGTKGGDIYVQLITGTGVYGDTNLTWDYCADAACVTPININSVVGSATWDVPFSNLTVDGAGPTYSLSYAGGLSSDYYTGFAAGPAADWTVTPATLTYTANTATMTEGGAVPALSGIVTGFVYADTQASATSGTLAFTTSATSADAAGSYAIDGSGLTAANYNFVQAVGNATALTINAAGGGSTPATGGTTTTTDSGKLLDIITKSLLKQSDDGGLKKTFADFLLAKKGKGIETEEKGNALEFIRFAVKEQCGDQCSVTEEAILEWLGGIATQTPQATLKASLTDEEVGAKGNRQHQIDERVFLSMNAHLFQNLVHMGSSPSVATTKVRYALSRARDKALDPTSGLDLSPTATPYELATKISPDLSDLSDNELEMFFYGTGQRNMAGDWPRSAVIAYLNRTANKGGTRTFRLENGRIVSTPEKAPHYHVTAETNLKPGTAVTVSIKDANGTTKSTKAVVGDKGDVKVDGAVGEMKQPLQIDISSEEPEYQSKPVTVFSMRSKAEEAFEKLDGEQRAWVINSLWMSRYNNENSEADAVKELLSALNGKDDPAYEGAKTALKEALESPNADEKELFEVLTNLPRRPENKSQLSQEVAKLDVAQQVWVRGRLSIPPGGTAADTLKELLGELNGKDDPAYDGTKTALKEVLESPNADEKKLGELLTNLRNSF